MPVTCKECLEYLSNDDLNWPSGSNDCRTCSNNYCDEHFKAHQCPLALTKEQEREILTQAIISQIKDSLKQNLATLQQRVVAYHVDLTALMTFKDCYWHEDKAPTLEKWSKLLENFAELKTETEQLLEKLDD